MAVPPIDTTTLPVPERKYFQEETEKDLVVLHFTAGRSARSARDGWLENRYRVSTAYIVDVDGTIYQTFDPKYWAIALYRGPDEQQRRNERRAVQVEIANVGELRRKGDALYWWPPIDEATGMEKFQTKWCDLSKVDQYRQIPFHGFEYYAAFPEAQMRAVCELVPYLCARFGIPAALPPDPMLSDPAVFGAFRGVAAHHNFRPDKQDVGPAFEWERLRAALA